MQARDGFAQLAPVITAWRRDLHAHPELLFDTGRTSAFVADRLRDIGCDRVETGIGRTGVVGVIHGRSTASGRVVALRADMDALPILEETGLPWASTTPGRMHACGHDGHSAMLLGAGQYLAETRAFDGTAVLIFQPAEEGGGGGRAMVEDGVMDRFGVQEVYGMHNMPGLPLGHFALRPGPLMAASDMFRIEVTGRGGHAAMPHDCVDPVVAAAAIIQALQTVASRTVDPLAAVVVSVTSLVTSSTTFNVIPESLEMKGTVRTLDTALQDKVEARLGDLIEATARAHGVRADFTYTRSYPATVNDPAAAAFAAGVAAEVTGAAHVDAAAPAVMGAEDFSFMLNARRGAFVFVGNGDTAKLHHPRYDFNDAVIPTGCAYWVRLIETAMPV